MKAFLTLILLITTSAVAQGQMVGGPAEIVTVYSQNERFYRLSGKPDTWKEWESQHKKHKK